MNRIFTIRGIHCDFLVRFELHPRRDDLYGYIRMTVEGATAKAKENALPLGYDLGWRDVAAIIRVLADETEGMTGDNTLSAWSVGKTMGGNGEPVYAFNVRSKKANVLSSHPSNTAFIDEIAATALFHVLAHSLTALTFGEQQFALSGVASVT